MDEVSAKLYARSFGSDNNAPVDERVMKAMLAVNNGDVVGYGDDPWTEQAIGIFKKQFSRPVEVFFVFNGTGANVVGLSAGLSQFGAVICASTAHINVDECGAPEHFTGCKLICIETEDGKLRPQLIEPHMHVLGVVHHAQPMAVSISQTTEVGTVYSPDEVTELAGFCRKYGLFLHMDGARISNAAASLGVPFDDFTGKAGVDILSFGGTKNGLMYGEAVVSFTPGLSRKIPFLRKNGMQLASKMRYIAAQFIAFFADEIWKTNALHANAMAAKLRDAIKGIPGLSLAYPVESNALFVKLPRVVAEKMREKWFFYDWDERGPVVRWMTSFVTREEDITAFVTDLKKASEN